jgi:hypothetical protein
MNLSDFSSKLPYVLENIQKYPDDKQYLYSSFSSRGGYGGHGVNSIAKELDKIGYEKMTIKEAKKLNKVNKLPDHGVKRYILVTNTELNDEPGNAGQNLHELLKIYNHPQNKDGKLIHIMIASNKYNESIDLKDVAHLHFFEPFISVASEKQAIGRAVRFCSFANKDRSKNEWLVKIHRYMSDKPDLVLVDKEPIRIKIREEIAELEDKIGSAGSKEALLESKKALKEKEKELSKQEKLIAKGKANEADVNALRIEVSQLQRQTDDLLKSADNGKGIVAELKVQLREKMKDLKKIDAPPKLKADNIDNIDDKIYNESRERFKELFTVYQCLKEAAVDCRILREFHGSTTGEKINCI